MTNNKNSRPIKPRLQMPTLPNKQIHKAQTRLSKTGMPPALYVNLQPSDSRQPDQCDAPRANLITDAPFDEEQKSVREPSNSNSSVSPVLESEDTSLQAPRTSRTPTGVYFKNVEIQNAIHPLQCCNVQEERSPLQACKVSQSFHGRPLSAAPVLPTRCQSGLKPLCIRAMIHDSKRARPFNGNEGMSNKKQRCGFSPARRISQASREAQVKEASFMIEAAVALANLHESNAC